MLTPMHPVIRQFWSAALLAGLAFGPGGARAQSTGDFRLQPGAAPRAPGPVDPEGPGIVPTPAPTRAPSVPVLRPVPVPSASPVPTMTAAPVAAPTTAPASEPTRSRTAPRTGLPAGPAHAAMPGAGSAVPALPGAGQVAGGASAPLPPVAAPTDLPVVGSPAAAPLPAPAAAPVPALAPEGAGQGGVAWWWLLPAALAGALAAWLVLRRRGRDAAPAPVFVRPQPVSEDGAPGPMRSAGPVAPVAPAPAAEPVPAAVGLGGQAPLAPAGPVELDFAALRLSVSLVNATLQYRLTLVNRAAAACGPLAVGADMIAAHASLPEDAQLGRDGAGLAPRHRVPGLAPGESVELVGELRLPLASVTPIRAGAASLLVPLVRLRIEGAGPAQTVALVVGETPASPGAPLRPFRLDQGPRIFGAVSQRALAAAA